MTLHKLAELLGEYALANPTVRLRTVTIAEFSAWYVKRYPFRTGNRSEPNIVKLWQARPKGVGSNGR